MDITQAIQANHYRLTLANIDIRYDNDGVLLTGIAQIEAFGRPIPSLFQFLLKEDIPAAKASDWLSATYIKDGGFGFPTRVDVIFSEDGSIFDIEGEPYRFTQHSEDRE